MSVRQRGILHNHPTAISLSQRFIDVFVIVGALYLSLNYLSIEWTLQHTTAVLLAVFIFHFTSELDSIYISWRGMSLAKEVKKACFHWFIASGIIFLNIHFFFADYMQPQELQLLWFSISAIGLTCYRVLLRILLRTMRLKGHNTRTFVVAGAGGLGYQIASRFASKANLGLKFQGFYDDSTCSDNHDQVVGDLESLVEVCRTGLVDRVYIALPMRAEERVRWLTQKLADSTTSVYIVPNVFMFNLLHARTDTIEGIPTISIYDSPIDGSNAIVKRLEDVIIGAIITLLISPVMLIIALAIKLTSKGPVLFKQQRYGIDGLPISVWKFRSMKVMENGSVVTQATKGDPRITPIGAFLRKTSLDELPQFFNVLSGQMSIVGPRPHAVAHNEEYRQLIEGYMLRHKVKPGITGWAQINGWRGETEQLNKMEKRVEYDLDYICNWSLWFDVKIIFVTIFKGFFNKNAY